PLPPTSLRRPRSRQERGRAQQGCAWQRFVRCLPSARSVTQAGSQLGVVRLRAVLRLKRRGASRPLCRGRSRLHRHQEDSEFGLQVQVTLALQVQDAPAWYGGAMAHDAEVKPVLRAYKKALDTLQRLDRDRRDFPSPLLTPHEAGANRAGPAP